MCITFLADLAPECAHFYHRYGEALFYKAQSESDVFGASLQKASREAGEDEGEAAEDSGEEAHGKAAEGAYYSPTIKHAHHVEGVYSPYNSD